MPIVACMYALKPYYTAERVAQLFIQMIFDICMFRNQNNSCDS